MIIKVVQTKKSKDIIITPALLKQNSGNLQKLNKIKSKQKL